MAKTLKILFALIAFTSTCIADQTFLRPVIFANGSSLTLQSGVPVNFGTNIATNAGDPISAQDLATKNYVDTHAGGSFSAGNLTDAGTDGLTITGGTNAVNGSGTSLSQHVSDTTHNGYLSSSDWNLFNGKQPALTIGNLTDAGTDGITITGGTGSVIGSGTSISQHVSDTTHNGYLNSTDWNTFNGKQNTITPAALTKTDDTNVTLTLGGTPSTALLQATSLTLGWTGTLAKTRGGFGADVSSVSAQTVYGNNTGSSGAPSFSSSPQFLKIGNLTTNGFVKTLSGDGTLTVDTSTYLTGNQTITLSGDATGSGTTAITVTNVNLPDGVTQAGSLLVTDIAAPSSPSASHLKIFGDSTDLRFHDKNAAGTIGTTVVADTGASNNFLTAISTAGVISKAQPSFSNLSGNISTSQMNSGTSADSSHYWRGDGTWATISTGASVANVGSQKVTLSAQNGSASTAMRSDAAPPLDQSIAPTWTGLHAWAYLDSGTINAPSILTIGHNTTSNGAAGFGTTVQFNAADNTTNDQTLGSLAFSWNSATHASHNSIAEIALVTGGSNTPSVVAHFSGVGGLSIGPGTSVQASAGIINAATGFTIANVAGTGKFIQADGAKYLASTYTLPTSAGTSGKILQSDGTNIVSSTPTFPTGSQTAQKTLVSDGTNWTAVDQGTWDAVLKVSGTDFTRTAQTLADITGLVTGTLSVSTLYEFEAVLSVNSSSTAGIQFAVHQGGTSPGRSTWVGEATNATATAIVQGSNAADQAGAACILVAGDGEITMKGHFLTGTGTPTFSIQCLKVTSGTAKVYIGSILKYRKA